MAKRIQINRYQIAVMLLTAAVTYRGLAVLMPADRTERALRPNMDRIHAIQALPIETEMVHSSRSSSDRLGNQLGNQLGHRVRVLPSHPIHPVGKPQAEAAPLDLRALGVQIDGIQAMDSSSELGSPMPEELRMRLELGLVPEAIVLPKREENEVSSLILVKPRRGQSSAQD